MKRVLIIGPRYYNFLSAVQAAFEKSGWETLVEMQRKSRAAYQPCVLNRFQSYRPDLVFVMNGVFIDQKSESIE